MKTREIGRTSVYVSELGLGGAPLGGNFVDLDDKQNPNFVDDAQTLEKVPVGDYDLILACKYENAPEVVFGKFKKN